MPNPTRRAVLIGTAVGAGAIAGGTAGATVGAFKKVSHRVSIPPPAPPRALTAALEQQQALAAGYDSVISASAGAAATRLTALRTDVASHGQALEAVLDRYPGWRLSKALAVSGSAVRSSATPGVSGSGAPLTPTSGAPAAPLPGVPIRTVAELRVLIEQVITGLSASCLAWQVGEEQATAAVGLLGSITGCLSGHLELLL